MELHEISAPTPDLVSEFVHVGRQSVVETHHFLTEKDIDHIAKFVPQAIMAVEHLVILKNPDNEVLGFMGVENQKLEMLFVLPEERGKGIGTQLFNNESFQQNEDVLSGFISK